MRERQGRKFWQRWGAIAGIVLCALMIGLPTVAAQEATPTGDAGEIVSPEECTTEARSLDELTALIGTPAAAPSATPITQLPEGAEPDEQTRTEVTAYLRQVVACTNTGEFLRALALYSDEFLQRAFNVQAGLTAEQATEQINSLATPYALEPVFYVRIVDIPVMRVLEDGHVVAVMTTRPYEGGSETSDLFVLERREDGWTIVDAVVQFSEAATAATPES